MQFNLVVRDGQANITVVQDGEMYVADETHPNFEAIKAGALSGDESVTDLFDTGRTIVKRFEKLSRSVSIKGDKVFFDNVEQDNALTEHLVQVVNQGVEDFTPLVNFYEKIEANPNPHSREHLYRWLGHRFTITPEGNIVGYRGLRQDFTSVHAGPGIVNGEEVNGHLDNSVGNVVELPRDQVTFDPKVGCAFGLHVGTWDYASGWGQGVVVEVEVDPRDVVSVPTDCSDSKMRVSRYTVTGVATTQREVAVAYDNDEGDYDDYNEYEDDDYYSYY